MVSLASSAECGFFFVLSSQRDIISSLELLKPVVAGFEFIRLFLSVARFDFLLHL